MKMYHYHESYKKWLEYDCPKVYCQCGCDGKIIVKNYHKWYGIPKFIHNHGRLGKNHPLYGKLSPFKGRKHNDISKQISSNKHKGKTAWNKGLTAIIDNRIICGDKHPSKRVELRNNLSTLRKGDKNPMFGKVTNRLSYGSYYNSPLQGKVWLKSSYELAYAKYLDSQKILWYYEIETFDLGDTTYTPDFFLPQFEKFIEIKGYMRSLSKYKIDKFLEQYPWDLEILYGKDLIKLGCEL